MIAIPIDEFGSRRCCCMDKIDALVGRNGMINLNPRPPRVAGIRTIKRKRGRNEKCVCGSGRKFKHCCLRKYEHV